MREGKGGRNKGKETSVCGCLWRGPHWGPGLQPRHVPLLGIKPATLWFTACAQSTELHQPGPVTAFLIKISTEKSWCKSSLMFREWYTLFWCGEIYIQWSTQIFYTNITHTQSRHRAFSSPQEVPSCPLHSIPTSILNHCFGFYQMDCFACT